MSIRFSNNNLRQALAIYRDLRDAEGEDGGLPGSLGPRGSLLGRGTDLSMGHPRLFADAADVSFG